MNRRTLRTKHISWRRWLIIIGLAIVVSGIWKGLIMGPDTPPPASNATWSIPLDRAPNHRCPEGTAPDHYGGCGPAPLPVPSPGEHLVVLYYDLHCHPGTSSTGTHLQADQWAPDPSGRYAKLPQTITLTRCQGAISS